MRIGFEIRQDPASNQSFEIGISGYLPLQYFIEHLFDSKIFGIREKSPRNQDSSNETKSVSLQR